MADTVEDGYEPDNSFTEYSSMTVTTSLQSQYRSIMPMYDGDYIQFSASPGMYIFNGSSTIDIYCSIYDENYNYLAGGALQSGISYVIYNSGSYFLTVYGYDAIGDYALNYVYEPFLGSLQVSPSSGPGGVTVQFTGAGYPADKPVTISYHDPTFGSWNYFVSTTSDGTGNIFFETEMPDLRKSVGAYDSSEIYTALSFRTDVAGTAYAYIDYNQYLRGIKRVGNQIASGLFGNGTNLASSVVVESGDTIALSGKWFHSNDVIYVKQC